MPSLVRTERTTVLMTGLPPERYTQGPRARPLGSRVWQSPSTLLQVKRSQLEERQSSAATRSDM
jgi:hypothetical protein